MPLNLASPNLDALPMATTAECASLLASAKELGIPAPASPRYASRNTVANGVRLHFLEWGDPSLPSLVLVHGGHQSAHSWDLVSLSLSSNFHVFAIDQRGHGDSEWARDRDYRTGTLADDLREFMTREVPGKPLVVGHSLGGLVLLSLLVDSPGFAEKLVVVDVGPEPANDGAAPIWNFIQASREFDDLDDFVRSVQAHDPFRTREHIERTVRYNLFPRADGKYVSKCDDAMVAARRNSGGERGTLADLASLTLPTLVVRGETSTVLTAEAAVRLVEHLPNAHLETVPKSGHNVHGQNTLGFLDVVRPFLESREL